MERNDQKGFPQPINKKVKSTKENDLPEGARNESGRPQGKSFIEHHYPDGVGPDVDLVEMLERDCIDRNP